ncbi:MAG: glycosyltransferase family 2 protein [Planctomycetes bacterium]|nr:glycosyltransferase family 2 protein [Planctomycetota bacterium]
MRGRSVSVFFPCYNEGDSVEVLVVKAVEVLRGVSEDFEVIIVDDGSSDSTREVSDRLAGEIAEVVAIHHQTNLGYGSALQTGFHAASKELVFYTDGDGQFDISEMPELLGLMGEYDIVSCYRLNRKDGPVRKLNAWCWGKLVCFVFGMKVRDIDCAFKLFKRKIFDDIEMQSTGALIDAEILARSLKKGYTVVQRGVHHYPRTAGSSTGANLSVIFRAFKELLRLRKEINREA